VPIGSESALMCWLISKDVLVIMLVSTKFSLCSCILYSVTTPTLTASVHAKGMLPSPRKALALYSSYSGVYFPVVPQLRTVFKPTKGEGGRTTS
jgi:hypothetical protein